MEIHHSQFSVLQDKEAYNDWFFLFNFRFCQRYQVKLVFDMPQSLENFLVDRWMCLIIIHKAFDWIATKVYNLIAIRAVGKQFLKFCNNTGFRNLFFLTTNIDSRLQKVVETYHRGVFNEVTIFYAYESQLQVKL